MRKQINMNGKIIDKNFPCFIIAEAGVNHNGSVDLALKLIAAARRAGADAVKFQTFKAENLVTENAPKAKYQLETTNAKESQKEMLKKLELKFADYLKLVRFAARQNIVFFSTPYNFEDVDYLSKLKVSAYKLASMHLTELPMIEYVAKKNKPVFLSTGMSTMKEIKTAAKVFTKTGNNNLIILQCTTNYPSRFEDANLKVMQTISDKTGTLVGYSDHTSGIEACVLAVAAGACAIEKHFTLDKNLPGPDQKSSANPQEFAEMVRRIRMAEKILGSPVKKIAVREKKNIVGMRRSLASKVAIPKGHKITTRMIGFKRPATGLSPNLYLEIIGKVAKKNIPADKILTREDVLF